MRTHNKGTGLLLLLRGAGLCFKADDAAAKPAGDGGTTTADPPAGAPPQEKKPDPTPAPAAAGSKDGAPPAKDPEKEKVELSGAVLPDDADDDELEKFADDDGYIKFPIKAFKTRINRATKKELKKIFGTDDRDAILKQKDDYEKLVNEREQERRAKLQESERLKEDLKKATDEKEALKREYEAKEEARLAAEGAADVKKIASAHVEEKYAKYAYRDFKKHVRKLSDEEVDKLAGDDKVAAWFQQWAKENPEMAKKATTDTDDKGKKKVGINTGGKDENRPPPPGSGANLAGKTPRPGQPNSMTKAELAEYMRGKGLRGHF